MMEFLHLEKQAVSCKVVYLLLLGRVLPLRVMGENGRAIKMIGRIEIASLVNGDMPN
ncbi:hypothetical protein B11Cv2_010600 [Bartonella sp. 1-1C]|nr:hypothetical protein B11Cv2_010600 [Bartonella sp. 1-1C]CBI80399.1 conserved hypothetical protein [Bartonella sp. 1-1C]